MLVCHKPVSRNRHASVLASHDYRAPLDLMHLIFFSPWCCPLLSLPSLLPALAFLLPLLFPDLAVPSPHCSLLSLFPALTLAALSFPTLSFHCHCFCLPLLLLWRPSYLRVPLITLTAVLCYKFPFHFLLPYIRTILANAVLLSQLSLRTDIVSSSYSFYRPQSYTVYCTSQYLLPRLSSPTHNSSLFLVILPSSDPTHRVKAPCPSIHTTHLNPHFLSILPVLSK